MVQKITELMRNFLLRTNKSVRDSYIWNMISAFLFGFQSVIILVVLTRTVSLEEVGIYTIGYANASLFLFIGKYGVRNYQVSDVHAEHSFGDYKMVRCISTAGMVATAVIYDLYGLIVQKYSVRKFLILLVLSMYKVPDAIEDVYFGEYQRNGRLDVAAKTMVVRLSISIFALMLAIIITRDLLYASFISTILSFFVMKYLLRCTIDSFSMDESRKKSSLIQIFRDCFPIFAGTFLTQYINNAPKYAIDRLLDDRVQACYGFIFMPVFVIGLLNNVIFSPIIYKMSKCWYEGEKWQFVKRVAFQIWIVGLITGICLVAAYFLGIPILSALYHIDLTGFRKQLMILLLGGGLLALAGLMSTVLTIMRLQWTLLFGYGMISCFAVLFSGWFVKIYGITGASWLYVVLTGSLFIIFFLIFIIFFIRRVGVHRT